MNLEINNIQPERFETKLYKNMFLGSDGRYVSLANTETQDFQLITPNFNTKLTVQIPNKNINKTGTYEETLIDKTQLEYDYYNVNPYATYGFGDIPLIEIQCGNLSRKHNRI